MDHLDKNRHFIKRGFRDEIQSIKERDRLKNSLNKKKCRHTLCVALHKLKKRLK